MKLHLLIELADSSFAFSVFFILGGAAWGPWAQAPPNWFWALALALALTSLKKNLTPKSVTNFDTDFFWWIATDFFARKILDESFAKVSDK